MKKYLLSGACLAMLAACNPAADAPAVDTAAVDTPAVETPAITGEAALGDWGIETGYVSETVNPGDDFFTYVNQGWLDTAEIPAGFRSSGAFLDLYLTSEERVNEIIAEAAASTSAAGTPEQQIGDLYRSYMDTDRIEALGLTPIQEELDAVLASSTHADIARWFGLPVHHSMIGIYVSQDSGNPERYLTHVSQAGLGLPNRDYYLDEGERYVAYRAAYVAYIANILTMAGVDNPEGRAADIMALETALAQVQWPAELARESVPNYHLMTLTELEEYAPGFDWAPFLDALGIADINEVVVNTDTAVQASAQLFAETPVEVLASYLAFHFVDNQTGQLPARFDEASFDFYSRTLNGVDEQRPRDLRAIQFVNGRFGENIGQVYVERHFPPEYKAQMEELVEYLRAAFAARITTLEWMDDATRAEAQDKLESFLPKIGYPDVWRDYSTIEISGDDLIGNVRAISAWNWADQRAQLNESKRDWMWYMSPQTVNAYYNPDSNEIVFPAAILQAPFFDPFADPAVNFAAIGGVIGHEMGHGFDDQGAEQDGDGVLRNWWTDFSREHFQERTGALVAQYDAFSPIEGEHVNGQLTLGENIGDLGGLSIAYQAYHAYLADHGGGEAPVLDGLTGDQRFFMSWAQVWRSKQTEDSLVSRLRTDPHSPAQYRVNGVVRNIDAWYNAFGITEDHELYLPPEERVSIW
ncbi:M13 family metallopeptidase [Maricaulis sp.]|uniref:M13 family metallopeptidase n=1 Tax=Maricaulis sp. TaxID=1486257 RepID=UPI003A8CDC55